jgi:P63C domain
MFDRQCLHVVKCKHFEKGACMTDKAGKGKAAGGYARAKALSRKERQAIAKHAALARWTESVLTATHEGVLDIGGTELPVAVLSDGRRVLTAGAMLNALGRPWKGSYKRTELPSFLDAANLKPFITKELLDALQPIEFRGSKGQQTGYAAETLPLVCDVYLRAREAGKIRGLQANVTKQAEILVRSLSKVGIRALVDEATGYQSIRPQDALQEYLKLLVRDELAAWVKKFPDEFYENIYKLKGWPWPGMSKNRYSVVAHYTRDLVYERMAPGLLKELELKSPKNEKGRRDSLLKDWLTEDIGDPMLAQHLHSLIMFQRLAIATGYGWKRFVRMVDQVLPKKDTSMFLPFIEADDNEPL